MKTLRTFIPLLLVLPFFGIACFSLQNCSGPDHSDRIQKVDSLREQLSKLREELGNLDTTGAMELQSVVAQRQRSFEAHYEKDSMGEEIFRILDSYKKTQKAFEGYRRSLRGLKKEFARSEEQLKALRKDLKRGVLSEKKAKEYVQDEASVLHRLQGELEKLSMKTKAGFRNFEQRPAELSKYLTLPDTVEWPELEKQ